MGEKHNKPFQLSFNSSLRVDFQGSRVTSDGGLILVRELEERLGMGALIEQHLTDTRRGRNTQFPLADLLRQSVYSRLAGYEDVHDAERVSADPTFRLIGSENIWERGTALTSRLHSFETEQLAEAPNLAGLTAINREWIGRAEVGFRADAAFAKPEIYEALEERGVTDAIRLPANNSLERDIVASLTRPVGRPCQKSVVWYKSFLSQAASWDKARRVVAKVEHHQGELFPRVGFIVTSLSLPSRAGVRFYNRRGTAEQWIKAGQQATHWRRLSCHRFRANDVRLQLSVLADNLGNLWRRLVLPKRIDHWSLTSVQQRLVKTGGRLVKHARYYWLLLAEGYLTRRLFGAMAQRIAALPTPAG